MVGFLSLLVPILALLLGVGWAFLVGLRRARIRCFVLIGCFVVALIAAISCTNLSYESLVPLTEMLGSDETTADILAFIESSETVQQATTSTIGAILAPAVFLGTFISLSVVTFIITWIVFLIMALCGVGRGRRGPIRTLVYAIVPMLLTVFVFVTPIAAYTEILPGVLDVVEQSIAKETDDSELGIDSVGGSVVDVNSGVVDQFNKSPLIVTYRVLGGRAVCNMLTSIEIGDETTTLRAEINGIAAFAGNLLELSGDIESYGESEAAAVGELNNLLDESLLLPTLAGEFIYGATDSWLVQKDAFFGMEKPALEGDSAQMFAEPLDHILEAFHTDARDLPALRRDFTTLANLISILARNGVFAGMGGETTDALVKTLSSGTVINDLIVELGKNNSFKILITDITNIGMRAIGSSLKIPENAEAVYTQFTDDIAAAINTVKSSDLTDEEKKAQVVTSIREAFAESGNDLDLGDDVLGLYADTLLEDFSAYEQVTASDVEEFFRVFAEVSEQTNPDQQSAAADSLTSTISSVVLKGNGKKEYSGSAYAGKSPEELKNGTAAGMLATILNHIVAESSKEQTEDEFKTSVQTILKDSYTNYANETGKDPAKAETFATVELKKDAVSAESINQTVSMKNADDFKQVTTKVTMEDLLTNSKDAVAFLDSEEAVLKEAQAIQNIFGSAADILDKLPSGDSSDSSEEDGMEMLNSIATGLGGVLDSLGSTSTVGMDKTNNLLTAVFQSETVRKSANLDMKTATELAKAATEKDENGNQSSFTSTMSGISTGANIANKLSKEGEKITEDDIRDMLEHMTPQTANMLKVYMSEDRIRSFKVPEDKVPISTELIQNLLTEMGDKQKYPDYESETKGILNIFNLATAASKNEHDTKQIFNRDGVEGKLEATAEDTVNSIFSSDMVCNAITKTLYKEDGLVVNPFGLKINEGNADFQDCKDAVEKYYHTYEGEKGDELKYRVDAVAALLGVTGINYEG